ncbi:MAG: hypothetical protein WC380_12545 [Pedobacter sp.]|jgi:hypothetical protein
MPKKKIIENTDYYSIKKYNEEGFKLQLKAVRPDVFVLMDLLDTTGVNYYIIFQIIRQLNNIAMGNKYGTVTAQVENGVVTFVRGEESIKLNEDLIRKNPRLTSDI